MLIRNTMLIRDRTESDEMVTPCAQLTRVAALAVLRNPFAGIDQDDLTEFFEYGAMLGAQLAAEAIAALGAPPVSYGKAAIVGAHGAAEHGAALLHPRLGKPARAAIGGGQALIPPNVMLDGIGMSSTCPLGTRTILGPSIISTR